MAIITIAGPFKTSKEARDTAESLGNDCSSYYKTVKDSDGYDTDEHEYFVERNTDILPGKIFGYDVNEFLSKQYK